MKVLDLFSGIGGFSLGLERAGMETVAFCEVDPFCQKVLQKHWQNVPILEDVTTHGFNKPVDLVTAGFPCQDISFAGKGAGLSGERSGLFWHILRTVRMVGQPKLLLENVAALLNRGMGEVLGALAAIGYDAEWNCIPAAEVGLPHIRNRLFIVASHSDSQRKLQPGWGIKNQRGRLHDRIQKTLWEISNEKSDVAIDGLSQRLLGNSVVPQIPEIIGRAIMEAEAA